MKPRQTKTSLAAYTTAFALTLLGATLSAADFTATWNGTSGNWTDAARWSTNPVFPNNGANTFDAAQSAGNVTLTQNITIEKYTFSAGTNTGASFTLTLNDLFTFSSGTMNGAGTTQANGGVAFSGTGFKDIATRALNLGGNSTWTAGQVRLGSGAAITNQTGLTFDNSFDGNMNASLGGGGTFNNVGTFTKSAGTGTTTIAILFNNSGTVNANSGTLTFSGGGTQSGSFNVASGAVLNVTGSLQNWNAGTGFAGLGTTQIAGGNVSVNAPVNVVSSFQLASGTLGGTGTLTVSGLTTFSSGTMNGAGTTQANGGVAFSGTGFKDIATRALNLGDNSTWTAGEVRLGSGAAITNQTGLTFDNSFDGNMNASLGGGGTFNNVGTFTKSAGTGTTTISSTFNNSGTVNANSGTLSLNGGGTSSGGFNVVSGAKLNFGGGTHDLNAGTAITAAGTVGFGGGTANFNAGTYTVAGDTLINGGIANLNAAASTAVLTLSSGTLGGAGTLTVSGLATFSGGTMGGAGTTQANGGMAFSGTGSKDLPSGRVLNLGGNSTWSDGLIRTGNGTLITNQSGTTFDISGNGNISNDFGGAASSFNNVGTFTKSAGTGTTTIAILFNNSGTVNANSGTLTFSGGGTQSGSFNVASGAVLNATGSLQNWNAGTGFAGLGTTQIAGGNVSVNAPVSVGSSFQLASGTLGGTGTLTVSGLTTFSSGTMNGAGTTQANGGVAFSGTGVKDIATRALNLGGNSTWTAGEVRLGSGAAITNQTGLTFDNSFDGNMNASLGGGGTFNNVGTFTKSAGTGTTTISSTFNNSGTVNANSGTLNFSGTYTQTAGKLILNGGNVTKSGGALSINGGSIEGSGTINGSAAVTAATLAPGFSPGSLAFSGDLTVTVATVFDIELGGFVQGTGYDFVSEAGSTALNLNGSTLELSFLPGFASQVNPFDTFAIISSNQPIQGSFGNVASGGTLTLPEGTFTVTYAGQNSVTLSNFVPVPEPSTYAVIAGLAGLLLAFQRRRNSRR